MDGYTLLKQVRDNRDWLSIPFVFFSAKGNPEDIHPGYALNPGQYRKKPFDPDD